ncbi:hypothetical protein Unana1_01130 [Umbelopsis nana]
MESASGMRSHIKREHDQESISVCTDEIDTEYDPAQIPPPITAMHVPAQPLAIETKTTRRAHDEALLQACNQLQENEEEKGKTLWIADKLKLRPFAIIDAHDVEHNALIHEAILSRILGQDLPTTLISTVPAKRKRECSCQSNNEATDDPKISILSATGNWKYQEKLLDRKHVELSEEIAEMLNEDWRLHP